MDINEVVDLTAKLIEIRSLPGSEAPATLLLQRKFIELGWSCELLPVTAERSNLFLRFGVPEILFTTHLDIVDGPSSVFSPRRIENRLYGRGAVDAKGIAATMIAAAHQLHQQKYQNFGLLFVVGEEDDGCGAKAAARQLQDHGIKFIVNGEPTENKLMLGHKGVYEFNVLTNGRACHSGYPEEGVDANFRLIEVLNDLYQESWGESSIFGKATINVGVISGGVAGNVISPLAKARVLIRSVKPIAEMRSLLERVVSGRAEIEESYAADPIELHTVPGFSTAVANFGSDIPNFAPLKAKSLLFGPGSILRAHTDQEFVTVEELQEAKESFISLYHRLV